MILSLPLLRLFIAATHGVAVALALAAAAANTVDNVEQRGGV